MSENKKKLKFHDTIRGLAHPEAWNDYEVAMLERAYELGVVHGMNKVRQPLRKALGIQEWSEGE